MFCFYWGKKRHFFDEDRLSSLNFWDDFPVSVFLNKPSVSYETLLQQVPTGFSTDCTDMTVAGYEDHVENHPLLGLQMKTPILPRPDVTRPRHQEFTWGLWGHQANRLSFVYLNTLLVICICPTHCLSSCSLDLGQETYSSQQMVNRPLNVSPFGERHFIIYSC